MSGLIWKLRLVKAREPYNWMAQRVNVVSSAIDKPYAEGWIKDANRGKNRLREEYGSRPRDFDRVADRDYWVAELLPDVLPLPNAGEYSL